MGRAKKKRINAMHRKQRAHRALVVRRVLGSPTMLQFFARYAYAQAQTFLAQR